jgi:hypothetical protein
MGNNHLYINGCSFTKGHKLSEEESWPFLVQKELNLSQKYENKSQNANSLGTIVYKSMFDLKNNSENTLVVIGLTWPTRYSVLTDDIFINFGPAYYESNETTIRNFVPLYDLLHEDDKRKIVKKNKEKKDLVEKYSNFLKELCRHDENFLRNQLFSSYFMIKSLEGFLKSNNIDYIFVEFQNSMYIHKENYHYGSIFEIDKDKFLFFNFDSKKMVESHPSKEQCIEIKEEIMKKIKKLYPKYLKSNQLNLF